MGVEDAGRDAAAVGEHPRGKEGQRGVGPDTKRGVLLFGGGEEGYGVCGLVRAGAGVDLAQGRGIGISGERGGVRGNLCDVSLWMKLPRFDSGPRLNPKRFCLWAYLKL